VKGRRRCHCRRVLLDPVGHEHAGWLPCHEALSTVDRCRHAVDACEPYRTMQRTMQRRVGPDRER